MASSINRRPFRLVWRTFLLAALLLLATLFVTHASIPGKNVEGCPAGCALSQPPAEGGLRVLSFNMLHGFPLFKDLPQRIDLIAQEIQRLEADVVLLQEVPWTLHTGNVAEVLAGRLGYNYLYYRANGNKSLILFEEGEAILSRYPLSQAVFSELKPRADFFDTRVVLGATVDAPWGQIGVFVAHLTNLGEQPAGGQAASLLEFVEANNHGLALVAGDFNSTPDSPQITQLSSTWTDAYRAARPDEAGNTCCVADLQADPDEPLEQRIDYVFLVNGGDVRLKAQTVFNQPFAVNGRWQWASDHAGLLVEIQP